MTLLVELVPSSCWYTNVRSNVTKAEWQLCKKMVRDRSGGRCEICGGRGTRWPVECHEIWQYDDERRIQTLVDLIALCPPCHEVKHIGRAFSIGTAPRAIDHLAQVNGWALEDVEHYLEVVFETWSQRSQHQWALDIGWLAQLGISTEVKDR